MSKLFWDPFIEFEKVEIGLKNKASSKEELEEMSTLVEERISAMVLEKMLDRLPKKNHDEFMLLFHECPYDEEVVLGYVGSKTGQKIEELGEMLRRELKGIERDILEDLGLHDEVLAETKISKK